MIAVSAMGSVQWIVAIAAALSALAVIGKYVRKAFRFVVSVGEGVEYVRTQMERNGGSTALDAIARIETTTTEMSGQLADLSHRVAVVEANTEIHARRLDSGAERMKSLLESLDTLATDVAELRGRPFSQPHDPQEARS